MAAAATTAARTRHNDQRRTRVSRSMWSLCALACCALALLHCPSSVHARATRMVIAGRSSAAGWSDSSSSSSSSSTGPAPAPPGPSIDWQHLTAAQLAQITREDFRAANSTDIAAIPGDACTGFASEQVSALGSQQCGGLQGFCAGNMSVDAVAGFIAPCVREWGQQLTQSLSAAQVAALEAHVFSAMTEQALSGLSASCGGLQPSQVGMLNPKACSGFQTECVSVASDDAFAQLNSNCSVLIPVPAWGALSGAQLSQIADDGVMAVMSADQAAVMNEDACAGLRPDQVQAFPDLGNSLPWWIGQHICSSLKPSCVAALSPESLASATANCVGDFLPAAFDLMSPAQIEALSVNATASLTEQQVAKMGAKQCGALSANQVSVLGTMSLPLQATCSGLAAKCVGALSPEAFGALSPACFLLVNAPALVDVNSKQLEQLSDAVSLVLSSDQLASLPGASCAGLAAGSVALFGALTPYDTCCGYTASCILHLPRTSLSALAGACIAVIDPSVLSGLALTDIAAFSSDALRNIDGDTLVAWVHSFGNELVDALTPPSRNPQRSAHEGEDLSTDALVTLKAAVASAAIVPNYSIPDPAAPGPNGIAWGVGEVTSLQLSLCTGQCMAVLEGVDPLLSLPFLLQLPLKAYRGLRGDQVSRVSTDTVSLVSPLIWAAMAPDALAGLTANQVQSIPPDTISSVDVSALSLPGGAVAALTLQQVQSIPASNWLGYPCAVFNNLTSDQRGLIAATSLAKFEQDCSGGDGPTPGCGGSGGKTTFTVAQFAISLAGTAAGTALLCLMAYCCCTRGPRSAGGAGASPTGAAGFKHLDGVGEGALHGGSLSFTSTTTPRTGRRGTPAGGPVRHVAGFKDASPLRQPLNPAAALGNASPLGPAYPPPASDDADEDDLMGSRF